MRRLARVGLVAAALVVAVVAAWGLGLYDPGPRPEATVVVTDADGSRLATVGVRVADTAYDRYVGLSGTERLADGEGMLFVHPEEGTYAYVMRDMAFPLDVVFVDANGTVTRIHHAPLPPPDTPNDELTEYRGRGRYVLEVPYGYTDRTGIAVGDRVEIRGYEGAARS